MHGDNLIYACKFCNSSKNKNDLLVWFLKQEKFPPILVLRRYLKLALKYFSEIDVLELPYSKLDQYTEIFKVDLLPYEFPKSIFLKL